MTSPSNSRRLLRRILTAPLAVLATILVLFDDLFRVWVKPAVARLAQWQPVKRAEAWISGLPPYGILALFLIPMALIEPLKILALYLIGTGHIISGIVTLVVAKIVGIGIAERLFAIGREKLLSIGWFRWCFGVAVASKDIVHGWLERSGIWGVVRRWSGRVRLFLGDARARFVLAWRERSPSRFAAAVRRERIERGRADAGGES